MSFRFPKTKRLAKPSEIRKVLTSGRKLKVTGFVIKWKWRENASESRVCVTVRKKQVRTSVARNRLRRLVKEFFRLNQSRFVRPVDIVVQAESAHLLKFEQLETIFKAAFKNTGILP